MQPTALRRLGPLALAGCLLAAGSAPATAAESLPVELPAPTGPYPVGTRVELWTDPARPEELSPQPDDRRTIRVQLWYPARPPASPASAALLAPYVPELGALAPALSPEAQALHARVRTHARLEASPIGGRLPVVLFSHGLGMTRSAYTTLLTDLASRGYLVAAVDHPYGARAVALGGGRVVEQDPAWEANEPGAVPLEQAFRFTEARTERWAADLRFVLDRLADLAGGGAWPLAGLADLEVVAAVGHSVGGKAALVACREEPRVRACVDLDGWPVHSRVEEVGLAQPLLYLEDYRTVTAGELEGWGADRAEYVANMRALQRRKDALFARVAPGSVHVMLRGIDHDSFTDAPFLDAPFRDAGTGDVPAGDDARADLLRIADLVAAFLDQHLRGEETPLLHRDAYVRVYGPPFSP